MDQTPEILIVGGGIGGHTLALALHRRRIACRIVEAAPLLQEIGAGINLLPHAVAVLADLGLEPQLRAIGVAMQELRFYSEHGQLIHAQPRGLAAGHRWPQYSVHRAKLQQLLLEAVTQRLGRQALLLGVRCTGVQQSGPCVVAALADGRNAHPLPPLRADAAIGCDGIHSILRAQLHEGNDPLRYSGVAMWRGVVRAPAFLGGHCMVLAGSLRAGKVVAYPINEPEGNASDPLLNWVAERCEPRMTSQDWQAVGYRDDLQWLLRDWRLEGLDVPALVQRTETVLRYPMVDKDPLPFWTRGRVTLLGDAAHPMYPFGSNGACQAILDAATLADCLAATSDVPQALLHYEQIRLPATAEVVRLNRQCAPDSILDEVDRRSQGRPFDAIEELMPSHERQELLQRYSRLTAGANVRHAPA
jgi:2-polyprenyl-6-methoxyphenol hydroxylase-like FAD-dependent oxidoreductase